jgi:hypothetical protein
MECKLKRPKPCEITALREKEVGISEKCQFKLELKSETAKLIYKKKPFNLRFSVEDLDGESVVLPDDTTFKIEIWLASTPSFKLEKTRKDISIIEGCTEVRSRGTVDFKKIYINDVSSHFTNGCFMLVVRSDNPSIQPFVFHNFIVRARKPTQRELSKRAKLVC